MTPPSVPPSPSGPLGDLSVDEFRRLGHEAVEWVARSLEPGFVGRLKERGAWGVYSTDLLSARALLSCSGIVSPPAEPSRPAP